METLYKAGHTATAFHKDDSLVRGIMGPIGSGKSVAMCWELFMRANQQEPDSQGIRATKWVIVRNTYRELSDTTMETWFQWFPKSIGLWETGKSKHTLNFGLEDGTTVHMEVIFRALDKPDDVKKLLSMEVTGGWINEAREVPRAILRALVGRTGRFPPMNKCPATWRGVIMDTNPPDDDHWWYKLFEEERPAKYRLFKQPSGLSPDAENIHNLPKTYYEDLMLGNTQEHINVYVHGQYGHIADGMPIYPEYNDDIHTSKDIIPYTPSLDIWVGIDFGRTPAALFAQQAADGQWRFIDEITTENMGATTFSEILGERLRREYSNSDLHIFGDPAGDDRSQVDERTPFDVLRANNIDAYPAPSQDPVVRRDALANLLTRITYAGNPTLQVSPKCRMLRKGLNGGYKYRRLQVTGEERFENKPNKNKFSHPVEAAEYLLVGAGEDPRWLGEKVNWDLDFDKLNKAAV